MENDRAINGSSFSQRFSSLFSHEYRYIGMKIFSRLYFLRMMYFFFSRLGSRALISLEKNLTHDNVVELKNNFTVSRIVEAINKNGYSANLQLNEDLVNDILDFSKSTQCYAYGDPTRGFYLSELGDCEAKLDQKILIARYFNFQDKDIFSNLINSPVLGSIAKQYLGKSAKNIATQLWWTFPTDVDEMTRSKAAHFFHRDVDGWAFVKFFFYITPVREGGGPHVYVKYSHRPNLLDQIFKERLRIKRHTDVSMRSRFGEDAIVPIFGGSGAGIAADTFGFHKGESPTQNPRLMLCAVYATADYNEQEFKIDPGALKSYKA